MTNIIRSSLILYCQTPNRSGIQKCKALCIKNHSVAQKYGLVCQNIILMVIYIIHIFIFLNSEDMEGLLAISNNTGIFEMGCHQRLWQRGFHNFYTVRYDLYGSDLTIKIFFFYNLLCSTCQPPKKIMTQFAIKKA